MSVSMPNWWVYKFHNEVNRTYQQMTNVVMGQLAPGRVRRGITAAIDFHERISNISLPDGEVRHGQSVILNIDHSRRSVTLVGSEGGLLVSDVDTLRSMAEPQNEYTAALLGAAARRGDRHILDAALDTAVTETVGSDGRLTAGSQAMLSAHVIGDNTAMDLIRIINANELLSKGSVPSGPRNRVLFYSPGQLRDILAITQASSSDFTKNQIHDRGTIDGLDWEGFHWVEVADEVNISKSVLERMLKVDNDANPTYRRCIAMARDAVGLSISKDYSIEIDRRPDLRNEIQVYLKMKMKGTRIFETGVVEVRAKEN